MSSGAMPTPKRGPKTGVYILRRAVPQALRPLVGWELKRSLKTRDPQEAKRRTPAVLEEFNRILEQAKQGVRCTPEDLDALRGSYFEQQRRAWREQAQREGWDDSAFEEVTAAHEARLDQQPPREYRKQAQATADGQTDPELDATALWWAEPRIDALAQAHGLRLRPGVKQRLAPEFFKAERRAIQVAAAEYAGNPPEASEDPEMRPLEARSWDALFAAYADAKQLVPSTRKDWGRMFAHFAEFMDPKRPHEVTKKDVRAYRDHLQAGGGLRKRPPSPYRINEGHLATLRAVFGWAVEEDILSENPVYGVRVKNRSGNTGVSIRGYTNEEVAAILQASRTATKAYVRWVPWLCAFTGARVSEILNAHKAHIGQTEGIWYLNIRPDTKTNADGSTHATRTKTGSSQRYVPLHSALVAEGFLEYLEQVPDGEFLFPGNWQDQHGNRTKAPANKLRHWIKTVVEGGDDVSSLASAIG